MNPFPTDDELLGWMLSTEETFPPGKDLDRFEKGVVVGMRNALVRFARRAGITSTLWFVQTYSMRAIDLWVAHKKANS